MDTDGPRKLLASPFVGFAPWIAMAVLAGPDRFVLAAAVALAVLILGGAPWWIGVGLIVAGSVLTHQLATAEPAT